MRLATSKKRTVGKRTQGHVEERLLIRELGFWGTRQARTQRRMQMGGRGRG